MFDPFPFARAILHRLDPETAHELTLRALEWGIVPGQPRDDDPILATTLFGQTLSNPIGLAAGFDKNGRVYHKLAAQGFGFVEIGGITPLPQAGNPRPRVFRLPEDGAVINRMGFPNEGADALARRLARKGRGSVPLGINLASNAESADPAADFVALAERFADEADFLTLDVSCPNTANGQVFLDPGCLADMLDRIDAIAWKTKRPTLAAKLGPDIDDDLLERLVAVLVARRIDAIIVSNTTRERFGIHGAHVDETGGLSGRPLFARSTAMLARVRELVGSTLPLIGVGGISSAADIYAKLQAGATAVQLYTALIYGGASLISTTKADLAALMRRDGVGSLSEVIHQGRSTPMGSRF